MNPLVFDYLMRFVTGLVLGGVLGSFITMLTYRLPRGKSLISPGSSCPSCRKKIAWGDLVPLYSYWRLKGKCRNCGTPFGDKYFKIEAISTAAITLLMLIYGFTDQAAVVVVLFLVVFSIAVIVWRQGKDE